MNSNLDIEIILKDNRISLIYNIKIILILILLVFIYVMFKFQYQSYYFTYGKIKDSELELLVKSNELSKIQTRGIIQLNGKYFKYKLKRIKPELIRKNNNNYQYIYLEIDGQVMNQNYDVKISMGRNALVKYLLQYIKGG